MLALFILTLWTACHSLETGSRVCGRDIVDPSQESCCAGVRFAFRTQHCCNDQIQSTACVATSVLNSLPSGPSLIIRADVNGVDAHVDTNSDTNDNDNDGTDNDDTDNDDTDNDDTDNDDTDTEFEDNDNDTDDGESQAGDTDDTDSDSNDDTDSTENDDDGNEATEDPEDETEDDDDTDDDVDDNSEDDDNETDDTDDTDTDNIRESGTWGAILDGDNGNNRGYNANTVDDMDYYVKITLINMWLILGLILIVNVVFYWCYCRRNNRNKRMDRVKSTNMFVDVDDPAPRSDLEEDAEII